MLLENAVKECERHILRLNYSYSKLSHLLPLSAENVRNFTDEETTLIDQYVYRFSKLHDTIGNKLFKAVLLNLDEEVYNKSVIDIFNRLEQLGYVIDYETWKQLREIRNEIAHNYEDYPEDLANSLNLILTYKDTLISYFTGISDKL